MIPKFIKLLFYYFFLLWPLTIYSQENVITLLNEENSYATSYLAEYSVTSEKINLDDAKKLKYSNLPNGKTNFGFDKKYYWYKIRVRNNSNIPKWVVQFQYPLLDFINYYIIVNDTVVSGKTGDMLPFSERYLKIRFLNFPLELKENELAEIYISIKSESSIDLNLKIVSPEESLKKNGDENIILGVYYGGIFLIALYNLFIFLFLMDLTYLYYSFYVFFYIIFQSLMNGIIFQFILQDYPEFLNKIFSTTGLIVLLFTLLFTINYFKDDKNSIHKKILKFLTFLISFFIIISLFLPYSVNMNIFSISGMLIFSYYLYYGYVCTKKDIDGAKYYLFAWILFVIGGITLGLKNYGILSANLFTIYSIQVGSVSEVLLFSLGLASKIEKYRKETEYLNKNLTIEVNIRTREFKEEKEKAERALLDLKETQAQLIDAEKMASLGQLVGGVAHEINNPIGVIKSNAELLDHNIHLTISQLPIFLDSLNTKERDIFFGIILNYYNNKIFLTSREERSTKRKIEEQLKQIITEDDSKISFIAEQILLIKLSNNYQLYLESLDFNKFCEIISMAQVFVNQLKSIDNIKIAIEKATRVVYALRTYLNTDFFNNEREFDLISEINKSLQVYDNLIVGKINVEKDFPDSILYNGIQENLSLVWKNLIFNAVQSMYYTDKNLKISITIEDETPDKIFNMKPSRVERRSKNRLKAMKSILISFQDTGCGIPNEVQNKVFSPFFTTKALGEGIGLGLYVSCKIIHSHKGMIYFNSKPGSTEFIVRLPI